MLTRDLIKHAREFKRRLSRHQYEVTDAGILFPAAHVVAHGEYFHSSNGQDERVDHNLLPTAGLNHLLSIGLAAGTQITAWYLALFSGAYTVVSGLTAANFTANATELTSNTEGYSETTRQVWTPGAVASGAVDNTASKAAFTIATATSVTIRGAALMSSSVKGGTTGTLISASRFTADRIQYAADVFSLGYRVTLTST